MALYLLRFLVWYSFLLALHYLHILWFYPFVLAKSKLHLSTLSSGVYNCTYLTQKWSWFPPPLNLQLWRVPWRVEVSTLMRGRSDSLSCQVEEMCDRWLGKWGNLQLKWGTRSRKPMGKRVQFEESYTGQLVQSWQSPWVLLWQYLSGQRYSTFLLEW